MHKIQEIIDNQEKFKNNILVFFREELKNIRRNLRDIKAKDKQIQKEKEKLEKRFKRAKFKQFYERLFFMHNSRNKSYYVWWDENNQEALILKYDQK